jgi:hypothetical protein
MRRIIAAVINLLCASLPAAALDMNYFVNTNEHLVYMNLWGEIVPGDDVKFRNMITPQLQNGNLLYEVNIFTVGGDVGAAIGIGRQIHTLRALTVAPTLFDGYIDRGLVPGTTVQCWFWASMNGMVWNNDPKSIIKRDARGNGPRWCDCASACFLIWSSGVARHGNFVGIHRSYFKDYGQIANMSAVDYQRRYEAAEGLYKSYLKEVEIPDSIVQLLFAIPSTSMHYLTMAELQLVKSTPYLEEFTQARCGTSKERTYTQGNSRITEYDNVHVMCFRSVLTELQRSGVKEYLAKFGQ